MSAEVPFARFVEIVAALRHPETGCPWDLEQTHRSIRPYLIEEAYEVLDAIDAESDPAFSEELGDLLLQVVLHAQIAKDRGAFTIDEVVTKITDKMIRRHPHVFGETKVSGSQQVLKNWEQIKSEEKAKPKDEKPASILAGVPRAMPQLTRAQRVGEKAARASFDWEALEPVLKKVEEEIAELRAEIAIAGAPAEALTTAPKERSAATQRRLEDELGDILFALCQVGRWLGVSSEDALRGSVDKFVARFGWMENATTSPLKNLSPAELDALWEQAKKAETNQCSDR